MVHANGKFFTVIKSQCIDDINNLVIRTCVSSDVSKMINQNKMLQKCMNTDRTSYTLISETLNLPTTIDSIVNSLRV